MKINLENLDKKKIIMISGGALAVLLVIVGALLLRGESPEDGEAEVKNGGIFSRLFPGGREGEIEGLPEAEELTPETGISTKKASQLTQGAISGATTITVKTGSGEEDKETRVRYIEKSTGHIYEIGAKGENRHRVSNTTILQTFESQWANGGEKLIIKSFDDTLTEDRPSDIRIFTALIDNESESLAGIFLPTGTLDAVVSPSEDKVFYMMETPDTTLGILTDFDNEKDNVIFSIPFSEFRTIWPSKNTIVLQTKPSSIADGFLYFLDTQPQNLERILNNIRGLTVSISPDTDKIIYSESGNDTIRTYLYDADENEATNFVPRTMPEKCVWSKLQKDIVFCGVPGLLPAAQYPDDWYQGIISFSDAIWKINISTGTTEQITQVENLDIVEPFLSSDENYFFFTNKKNNALWSVELVTSD
jgi:hypothetical protein